MVQFVIVNYSGKEKATGRVFDTTVEKVAKENGVYNKDRKYEATVMIIGGDLLIPGFEETLEKMKPGEEKTVEIPPERAYKERSLELVKLIPLAFFKSRKIDPKPGMWLRLDNVPARIQTVSGGRVRVDFNHELAGKTLVFTIKLEKIIEDVDEKVKALFQIVFPDFDKEKLKITKNEGELELLLPKEVLTLADLQARKLQLIENIKKFLGFEKVRVNEEY